MKTTKAILSALATACMLSQCSTTTASKHTVPRVLTNPEQAGLGPQSPSLVCLKLGSLKTPATAAPLEPDQWEWSVPLLREARERGIVLELDQPMPPPPVPPLQERPWEAALRNPHFGWLTNEAAPQTEDRETQDEELDPNRTIFAVHGPSSSLPPDAAAP